VLQSSAKEETAMLNLMGKRYMFFFISLAVIIPGIIAMAIWGLPLSNEFKGGSLLEVRFASGKAPAPQQVVDAYHGMGIADVLVSTSGPDVLIIHSSQLPEGKSSQVTQLLGEKFNDQVTVLRFDNVGPTLAKEVTQRGVLVVLISSVVLTIFITLVFRGVANAFRYGICTVAALIHDVLVMLSVAAITGHFLGWEVDTLFLTAILTVIAFSAQDTIVLFDRIRENTSLFKRLSFETMVNHSVVQTLTRSINTQIMAVDLLLLSLALFGGATLQKFAIYLLVGMLSGSYSSEFNAAPLLIVWQNREWKTWFRRSSAPSSAA
jgi:preprotein translocase subunit SecF